MGKTTGNKQLTKYKKNGKRKKDTKTKEKIVEIVTNRKSHQ